VALLWLAAASRGGLVAVVDLDGSFYPPAAATSGLDLEQVVVVRPPDRRGAAEAVSRRAAEVAHAGGVRTEDGRRALAAFDAELRDPTNSHNPGTTADLSCAALFVVILEQCRNR